MQGIRIIITIVAVMLISAQAQMAEIATDSSDRPLEGISEEIPSQNLNRMLNEFQEVCETEYDVRLKTFFYISRFLSFLIFLCDNIHKNEFNYFHNRYIDIC
jgi:hypothetical protein